MRLTTDNPNRMSASWHNAAEKAPQQARQQAERAGRIRAQVSAARKRAPSGPAFYIPLTAPPSGRLSAQLNQ